MDTRRNPQIVRPEGPGHSQLNSANGLPLSVSPKKNTWRLDYWWGANPSTSLPPQKKWGKKTRKKKKKTPRSFSNYWCKNGIFFNFGLVFNIAPLALQPENWLPLNAWAIPVPFASKKKTQLKATWPPVPRDFCHRPTRQNLGKSTQNMPTPNKFESSTYFLF